MATKTYDKYRRHLTFAAAGTQTIYCPAGGKLFVQYLDIFTAAGNTITVSIGATVIIDGNFINSPVQLTFGKGEGSGVDDEDITVVTNAAAEIFVGYSSQT